MVGQAVRTHGRVMPHWLELYLWLKTHNHVARTSEPLKELRGLCFASAASLGFPWCQFRPMPRRAPWTSCLVVPGRAAWAGMCEGAPLDDLGDALLELEVIAYEISGRQQRRRLPPA